MRHRTHRTMALLLALLLAVMTVAGCGSESAGEKPVAEKPAAASTFPATVTDDAGREVTITEEPLRIVSLAPANTEIVAALGLLDRLVGVTTYCDYPPEVVDLPKIGDFVTPNVEAIAAAEPDLVLATTGVQADVIEQLESLGAAVVAIDPQTVEGVISAIGIVGKATGAVDEAAALAEGMTADLDDIRTAVAGEAGVTCFVEIAQNPLFTAGNGTLIGDLVGIAGGANVVGEDGYVAYSLEQLVTDDPAVYLATKGSMSDPADIQQRPGYGSLSAVKAGRVATLDDNLVSRPGPRIVQGALSIAEVLHPDAFK